MDNHKKPLLKQFLGIVATLLFLYSCASIGRPDGGPIDETPPVMVSSSPEMFATNIEKGKITLHFDEYIKLENASQKVVVSPPQMKQPMIKPMGKRITVTLQDTLIPNTTYTIDFGDAIVDNNEGNPMGDFTFTFSTGDVLDTMAVSGTVLEAQNLEPIKGIMVGLHKNLNDTAFTSIPFIRVAVSDSRGKFTIYGVAPGEYKIYALKDDDQNYIFSQKSEKIAFLDSIIIPRAELSVKNDTIWKDSLTVDTIIELGYTKFLPNDILLRAFNEKIEDQYLKKSERKSENILFLQFAEPINDSLPKIKGINFDESTLVKDCKMPSDTIINYYVKDSLVYAKDSLLLEIQYPHLDTLNQLVNKTDTLLFLYKHKKITEKSKKDKKKEEEREKEEEDSENIALEIERIKLSIEAQNPLDVYESIRLKTEIPIESFDQSKVNLLHKVDTLWENVDKSQNFSIYFDDVDPKIYNILYNWKPGDTYKVVVDSAAIYDIYNLHNDKLEKEFTVKKLDDYGTVTFNVSSLNAKHMFIELLDTSDNVVRVEDLENNQCTFYYLNPGQYGARLIVDSNNNGIWDTGNYEKNLQPETVYYYPQLIEFKANWSTTQDWDVLATPTPDQKPKDLLKQKPDEDKKKQNKERQRNR